MKFNAAWTIRQEVDINLLQSHIVGIGPDHNIAVEQSGEQLRVAPVWSRSLCVNYLPSDVPYSQVVIVVTDVWYGVPLTDNKHLRLHEWY